MAGVFDTTTGSLTNLCRSNIRAASIVEWDPDFAKVYLREKPNC